MDAKTMLEDSAASKFYLMLRYNTQKERRAGDLEAHLAWMIGNERAGVVFLSGPVKSSGKSLLLAGVTVIRAENMGAAEKIICEDPFVKRGLITYELHEWTAYEGHIRLVANLSNSSVIIG